MATRIAMPARKQQTAQKKQTAAVEYYGETLVEQLLGAGKAGSTGTTRPGSTGSQPQPSNPATPATPSGPSVDLQTLLVAIPIAVDGQVITAEYHNSLRAAIIGIANEMGVGLTDTTTTYTYAPAILPIGNGGWTVEAVNFTAQAAAAADGWLPLHLPDGENIDSMTVTGKLTGGPPASFQVILCRAAVDAADEAKSGPENVITLELNKTPAGTFSVSGSVAAASGSNALDAASKLLAAQAIKLIDNANYKYFVRATVKAGTAAAQAQIDAIQIAVGA